jgi:hypothetical protein
MTADQNTLAIWGGGLLAGLIVGYIILVTVRGSEFTDRQGLAQNLGQEYEKLYPADGMVIAEAIGTWELLKGHQKAALNDAEKGMVPALPNDYQQTDLSSGSSRVQKDLDYLKQKAQRTKVKLPSTLPFEEGLSPDSNQRLLQLAQLYLYRHALDTCMDAGVTKINNIKVETGPCDPQGQYAVLQCQLEIETAWDRTSQLLADLNQTQNRMGYGLRGLTIDHDRSGSQRISMSVSLLTANNPAWGLRPDSAPTQLPAAATGSGTSTSSGGSGGRFSRFGGDNQ